MANRISVTEDQIKGSGKRLGKIGPRADCELDRKAFQRGTAASFGYHSGACVSAAHLVTATRQRQTVDADAAGTIQNPGWRREGSQHVRITREKRIPG
jgi:hypothetical protein